MSSPTPSGVGRDDIRRGFLWLGAASAVARVLDAGSVLVVMWFVSREELGLATLAWSVSVLLEAMNGFGLGTALLQSRQLDDARLSAAFWYTMGLATVLVLGVAGLSPWLAQWFGQPSLTPMIAVSAAKLWLVGAALVPLTLLNRAMSFEKLAAVSTAATLFSGLLTCGLAALGFGAWGLVIGQSSHGLFTMIGALVAQPFWPKGRPRFGLIRDDIVFGAKVAASSVLYHFYRNADYYLIGRFLGIGAVGVYRVAFDLAMTPTAAVLNVVNRAALPVYARLSDRPSELKDAFLWTLNSLGILLAPVTAFMFFAADDLLRWVDGGRWLEAVPMVRWLAIAALIRCIAQTFPQVFHAMRRPLFAVYDSIFTMFVLLSLLIATLLMWGQSEGAIVAAWTWAAVYPITALLSFAMVRVLIPIRARELFVCLRHTAGALLSMSAAALAFELALRARLPPLVAPLVLTALLLASYAAYVRLVMGVTLAGLVARRSANGQ